MVTKDDCFKRGSYSGNSHTEAANKASEGEGWDNTEKGHLKLIAQHNFNHDTQDRIQSATKYNKYLRFVIEGQVYQFFYNSDTGFAIMKFLQNPLAQFCDDQIKNELTHRSNNISFGESHVCYFYIGKESDAGILTDRKRFPDQNLISEMYERCRGNAT